MEPDFANFTLYADWMQFIKGVCHAFVLDHVANMAQFCKPWLTSFLGVYVLLWGWVSLLGAVHDPFTDMVKRVLTISTVVGIALNVAIYNSLITDFFINAPDALATAMAHGPAGNCEGNCVIKGLDTVLSKGYLIGKGIWMRGGIMDGDVGAYVLAVLVWFITAVVTAYGFGLMALAFVTTSVLLPFGSVLLILTLFRATATMFDRWLQQLINYLLVPALVVAVNLLVMKLLERAVVAVSAAKVVGYDKLLPVVIMGIVCFMALWSVLTIAASLSGSMALSSFGMGQKLSDMIRRSVKPTAKGAMNVAKGTASAWSKGSEGLYNASGYVAREAWGAYTGAQARRAKNTMSPTPASTPASTPAAPRAPARLAAAPAPKLLTYKP